MRAIDYRYAIAYNSNLYAGAHKAADQTGCKLGNSDKAEAAPGSPAALNQKIYSFSFIAHPPLAGWKT